MIMINEGKDGQGTAGVDVCGEVSLSRTSISISYTAPLSFFYSCPSDPITELTPFKCLRRNGDACFGMIGEEKKKMSMVPKPSNAEKRQ